MVETHHFVTAWRTLLAAVVAAAMAGYIYWVENPRIQTEQEAKQLILFDPTRVDRVELRYPNEPTLVVERSAAGWQLITPVRAPADGNTIRLLVDAIRNAEVERGIPIEDAEGLATYGLDGDGSRAYVSLRLDNGSTLPAIIVGRTTPVGYQAFVRVDGRDELLVTPLIFHSGVKKTTFDLRTKTVFTVDPAEATAATVTSTHGRYALENDNGRWKIVEPAPVRADANAIMTLLSSLNALTALAYFNDSAVDRDEFGLSEAVVRFEARFADGHTEGIRVGAASGDVSEGFYVERLSDGQVFMAPPWIMARYDVGLSILKDKHLFSCSLDDVAKISIDRADGRGFTLERSRGGDWQSPNSPQAQLNARRIERTARGLVELAGESIVSQATKSSHGLNNPDVRAAVTALDGRDCGTALAVRAPGEVGYYVANGNGDTVMAIPEYLYSRLDVLFDDLIDE